MNFLRIAFLSFFFSIAIFTDAAKLFEGKQSDYSIVICKNASNSENKAASELVYYLQQISGATIPKVGHLPVNDKYVYVGFDNFVASKLQESGMKDDDEGFRIYSDGSHLFIYGGRNRGTLYGVYQFLSKMLGIRWYTPTFTKIPRQQNYTLNKLNLRSEPAFKYRSVFCKSSLTDESWAAHNGLNSTLGLSIQNQYGGISGYLGVHTMQSMLPPSVYFDSHPEFFALRDGKRVSDGQYCLSNPSVIKILTKAVLKQIAQFPGNMCYDVSQMDNELYCECSRCQRIEKRYGGHSGLMIWAINQIASSVKSKYPHAKIGTLAYQYTQAAPKGIKPLSNVIIRLCSVGCCFSHPIMAKGNSNFYNDFMAWRKLTDNLYIWDYSTSFVNYLMPFPNFRAVSMNLRFYHKQQLLGIMEQGQYECDGGEFCVMKAWIFSQLLWNPNLDIDALACEFIDNYYGPASDDIKSYYQLCNQLAATRHLMFATEATDDFITEDFLLQSAKLINSAWDKVEKDSALRNRVEEIRAQLLYLHVMRHNADAKIDGTEKMLIDYLRSKRSNYREGRDYKALYKILNNKGLAFFYTFLPVVLSANALCLYRNSRQARR